MAQKKKVKQKKQTFVTDLYIELIGIGLILLSILTLGQLGIIGTFLKRIFLFVFGEFLVEKFRRFLRRVKLVTI